MPPAERALLDGLAEVVFHTDAAGHWTYLNRAWTEITGFGVAESLGRPFLDFIHPDERGPTLARFAEVIGGGAAFCHHDTRYLTASGDSRWVELRARPIRDESGAIVANTGTIIDISERRAAEQMLADQTHILELIARGAALEQIFGELEALVQRTIGARASIVLAPVDKDAPVADAPTTLPGTGTLWPPRVDVPIVSATAAGVRGVLVLEPDRHRRVDVRSRELISRVAQLGAIAIDRERAETALRDQALHDHLTGLANRALLRDRLDHAMSTARREDECVALFLFDLNRFKDLNDALGHSAGDEALRAVAERARGAVRAEDTVARIGGDEFAAILPGLTTENAERVGQNLLEALRRPLSLEGTGVRLDASLGIALFPTHGGDAESLFRRADAAMYRAKRRGIGLALFDPESDRHRLLLVGLVDELRRALERDELFLHYQPKIDLRSGSAQGVEALVRWRHPRRGVLSPDQFIAVAEQSGLIGPLSLWVLHQALRQQRVLADAGHTLSVAVNLSPAALNDGELTEAMLGVIREADLHHGQLELEITERAVIADLDAVVAAITELSSAGAGFAIDDYGTGYSSLASLRQLNVGALKIDKSFVREMAVDERDATIVRSSIELAHTLGLGVVAEGVESAQICALLRDAGCDQAQGYHFARPMPPEQLLAWLGDGRSVARR